jgi:coniferyl-aldehyde dehydrogenase
MAARRATPERRCEACVGDRHSMSSPLTIAADPPEDPARLLERQRAAQLGGGPPDAALRRDRLGRALDLLIAHQSELCEALAQDFGRRPAALTRLMDLYPAVHALRHARRHVTRWMVSQPVRTGWPLGLPGTRSEVRFQPLGVVGVISPWNYPLALTFGPLAGILAAGNRCLLKPSEITPATSELLAGLIARRFDPSELAVVNGGPEVAEAFSRLPFDHLLFTGSTAVGRRVMTAAAEQLVPVTLELGGKCPVILGRTADLSRALDRVLLLKLANAGQTCLAPDYLCVPRERLDSVVRLAEGWVRRAYPDLAAHPDYTTLISTRHAGRALELLRDARAKGGRTVVLGGAREPAKDGERCIPPTLILDATPDMRAMQEEIFAPILPVLGYERLDEALAEVRTHPPPLSIYYFGRDRRELGRILDLTRSGAVTVNDVASQFLVEDLPFGGVGASGMGAYHGERGFRQFSHARAVFRQTRIDVAGLVGMRPPYGARLARSLRLLIGRL